MLRGLVCATALFGCAEGHKHSEHGGAGVEGKVGKWRSQENRKGKHHGGWHMRMQAVSKALEDANMVFSMEPTKETGRAVTFSSNTGGEAFVNCIATAPSSAQETDTVVIMPRSDIRYVL